MEKGAAIIGAIYSTIHVYIYRVVAQGHNHRLPCPAVQYAIITRQKREADGAWHCGSNSLPIHPKLGHWVQFSRDR
jgi:hypothetical protein